MDENVFKKSPLKLVGSLFVCPLGEIYWQAVFSVNHVLIREAVIKKKKSLEFSKFGGPPTIRQFLKSLEMGSPPPCLENSELFF